MVKVSVIVPVYNMEKYLGQCMDSIIGQTLKDIEVFCINDGSVDSSLEILKQYQQEDGRVTILNQENQGVAKARNTGIRQAKGKYVIFMDPDDWYPSEGILEMLYQAAEQHQVSIAGGSFMDYHDGIYNEEFEDRYYGYHFKQDGVIDYKDYQFDFGYQRFIFQREMLVEHGIFFKEYVRYQDPPFMVEAMICAGRFYGIDKPSYCYRYGHETITWNEKKVCDVLKGIQDNLDISRKYGLEKLHQLCVVRLNEEYRQLLGDSIVYEDYAVPVYEAMMETLFHIDTGMLGEMDRNVTRILSPIIARIREDAVRHNEEYGRLYRETQEEITKLWEMCDRKEREKTGLRSEIANLPIAMRYLDNDRMYLENDNRAVYESFSYRFGHSVTGVPRWVYRKLGGS